ncbi:MAG: Gfo/Idh/MocA family oxidoreductase, partial [Planctomycetaceae bacterium]|nr:Gfo/Idh/MocA family oxidoreductase [Planctomycetaceae bacterium]
MSTARIRIGIVGAGANTRDRHIPGFKLIPGVELTGVVNRSPESSNRIAQQHGIPKTYSTWQELVADPDIDAVMIGTWPNLHADVTVAALNAGKHVLTEARMARDLDEARRMHAAAKAHPDRVAMIVPSPFGLVHDTFIKELIRDDFLGDIREVVVIGADDTFRDYTKFLHWRQDREISGNNILMMGILHETVSRWISSPSHVFAQSATFEPTRPSPDEQKQVPITVPESVQILTRYPDGARGIYHMSGSILFGPGKQIHLYGARGTIKVEFGAEEKLYVGRAAQKELTF